MNEFHYFPSPIYREEIPDWVPLVSEKFQKYFDWQDNWNKENNLNYLVTQTQNATNDPDLLFLQTYFKDKSIEILKGQGYLLDGYNLHVSGMWGQEIKKHGMHEPHVHAHTQMCGLYFLDTPENGSYPIFSDPRPGKVMCDYLQINDGNVHVATPKIHFNNVAPGTFMFFNAWLPHQFQMQFVDNSTKFIHFTLSH
jgi:uncharacterized protein (TIGR02466 family)